MSFLLRNRQFRFFREMLFQAHILQRCHLIAVTISSFLEVSLEKWFLISITLLDCTRLVVSHVMYRNNYEFENKKLRLPGRTRSSFIISSSLLFSLPSCKISSDAIIQSTNCQIITISRHTFCFARCKVSFTIEWNAHQLYKYTSNFHLSPWIRYYLW